MKNSNDSQVARVQKQLNCKNSKFIYTVIRGTDFIPAGTKVVFMNGSTCIQTIINGKLLMTNQLHEYVCDKPLINDLTKF